MKLQLRDIQYFAVVAEYLHVGRAAEALGISQPALSKSLRRLESALAAKVVARTPRGVELTSVGSALLERVGVLRLALEDIAREAADISSGREGHLRVGVGTGFAEHLFVPACIALLKRSPKVTLDVVVENYVVLGRAVAKGQLDFSLGRIPAHSEERLVEEHLYDDEFVIYASTRHRLARRGEVKLADLSEERFATTAKDAAAWQALRRAFQARGLVPPKVALQAGLVALRVPVIASSDLLGFSSKPIVRQGLERYRLKVLPVNEWTWRRSVGISYRTNAYLSPAARELIQILKTVARKAIVTAE